VPADSGNPTPTYRINVVSRTTRAVSYRHRSGATKINFQGTDLMPGAAGEAKVESKRGALEIEVEFSGLDRPTSFGNEYLTYVLWAISPEGRPMNIGEVLVGENHRSKMDVTTDLQAFALIVTAEPYYAVRRPSNLVVLENSIRSDTVGATEVVDAIHSDHLPDPARKVPLSADHGITGNEPGEPRLFPIFRALWSLRQDEIPQFSCTVPYTHSDFFR
jgi:hypothetical protein